MPLPFLPDLRADTLTDLTPALLRSRDIRLLMLDFDNTIVPYTTDRPTEAMVRWLSEMQQAGIMLCVVSNSKKPRVRQFCAEYGLPCITHAKKPFSKGIRECLDRFGLPPSQCALAGDQIYTDTLGANAMGVCSILVRAIDNHNIWLKLRHGAEMPWIIAARKRRVQK